MAATLSQELIDTIVDYLWEDLTELLNVALVHQSWLPASRYHTFRCVIMGYPKDLNSWLDLVNNPLATFPQYVRDVKLWSSKGPLDSYNLAEASQCWTHPRLANVTGLYMSDLHVDGELPARAQTGIKELQICAFLPSDAVLAQLHLQAAISLFDSLEQLGIILMTSPISVSENSTTPGPCSPPNSLVSLAVDSPIMPDQPQFFQWLNPIPLTEIILDVGHETDNFRIFGNFLRQSSATLRKIGLDLSCFSGLNEIANTEVSRGLRYLLDFSGYHSLQALHLHIREPEFYNADWFLSSLASISPPSTSTMTSGLKLLVFTIRYRAFENLQIESRTARRYPGSDSGAKWKQLNGLLSTRFDLKELWFIFDHWLGDVDEDYIPVTCLPSLKDGVIRTATSYMYRPPSWSRI